MGYYSAFSVGRHALAVSDRSIARVDPARPLSPSEPSAADPAAEAPDWDEVAMLRSIHVSAMKLRIGLATFVISGVLSGLVLGWSVIGFVFFGLVFGVVVGHVAGSVLGPRSFRTAPWSRPMIGSDPAGSERTFASTPSGTARAWGASGATSPR